MSEGARGSQGPVAGPRRSRLNGRHRTLRTTATQTALEARTHGELFTNSRGVRVGAGELWFASVGSDPDCRARTVRLIAVNPP